MGQRARATPECMAGHVFRCICTGTGQSVPTISSTDRSKMNAAGQLQFDHPLFDTFDLVRISHEDLDIGGRFTRNLTAINGVMSFRVRDGQGLTAREPEISVQAMRREGSLTPCYNADRYGNRHYRDRRRAAAALRFHQDAGGLHADGGRSERHRSGARYKGHCCAGPAGNPPVHHGEQCPVRHYGWMQGAWSAASPPGLANH